MIRPGPRRQSARPGAEADAICGAAYGERSERRKNTRNGYQRRDWDTRAGSIALAIPKLRQGSYFLGWLLERRRGAEAALVTVVATSYLLGVSTRRMAGAGVGVDADAVADRNRLVADAFQLGDGEQSDPTKPGQRRGLVRLAAPNAVDGVGPHET